MANETELLESDETEATTNRKMDAELRTMGAILRLLDEMNDQARARVIDYLSKRFNPTF